MKTLILFAVLLLAFACTEEVIVEKIVKVPEYITQTVTKTDTLVTTKEVVKDSIVYVPVYEAGDTIHHYDTVYVPVFVEVVDTLYIERSAKFEYDPIFEDYVNELLRLTQHLEPLIVDITMVIDNDYGVKSEASVYQGGWLIRIKVDDNCYEACVYRELMHCLYGKGYFDGIMIQNWEGCLETMDERGRGYAITDATNI